jgi:hypothetical protein
MEPNRLWARKAHGEQCIRLSGFTPMVASSQTATGSVTATPIQALYYKKTKRSIESDGFICLNTLSLLLSQHTALVSLRNRSPTSSPAGQRFLHPSRGIAIRRSLKRLKWLLTNHPRCRRMTSPRPHLPAQKIFSLNILEWMSDRLQHQSS